MIRPERAALTGENGLLAALGRGAAAQPRRAAQGDRGGRFRAAAAARRTRGANSRSEGEKPPAIVLAIDQAEELFRPEGAAEGAALLALIRDLTREDSPAVIAIFAIRSDGYDALEHAKPLEGFAQTTLPLLPMPRGAYKDVIEGPARRFTEAGGALGDRAATDASGCSRTSSRAPAATRCRCSPSRWSSCSSTGAARARCG